MDLRIVTGEGRWLRAGTVLIRTRRARRTQDAGAALRALARGADRAVGLRLRGQHILLLLDPTLAGELLAEHATDTVKGPGLQRTRGLLGNGLLTSEGADHQQARRLVAPAFSPRRLRAYTEVFADVAERHTGQWHDGQRLDMHHEMATLTLEIVGRTLLGRDLSSAAPEVRAGLEAALADFGGQGTLFGSRSVVPQATSGAAVHVLVDEVIAARRTDPAPDGDDVVSALIGAELSDREVHDHVITLLLAGHETTANALTWTLHLLAGHPEVLDRLQAEVGALGRRPSFDDVAGLRFTRAVVSEAMRIYPPAWIIGRTTTTDLTLGGWRVPAGAVVAVSPLLLHHDARWFPAPEAFDPARWLDERAAAVPRHAYLPFGTGPRACIGEQFAWTEAVMVLAVLASGWVAATVPGRVASPQYRVTMRPEGGLAMSVHRR